MSHSGLKSLDDVAQAICLPNERAPVRLPTYPSIDKTALFRYRYQNTQSLRDAAPAGPYNTLGRKRFVVTRDPAAPLLVDTVHYLQQTINGNPAYHQGSVIARAEPFDLSTFGPASVNDATTSTVDFDKMYPFEYYSALPCGELDSKQWFLVPKALDPTGRAVGFLNNIGVALFRSSNTPQDNQAIRTYRKKEFNSQGGTVFPNPEYPPGTLCMDYTITIEIVSFDGVRTVIVQENDYTFGTIPNGTGFEPNTGFLPFNTENAMVRIKGITYNGTLDRINSNGQPSGVNEPLSLYPAIMLTVGGVATGFPVPFRCLSLPAARINPEYYNSVAPFKSTRLNASSLLLTNVTKVLNKEGTVESSRLLFNPDYGHTIHNSDVVLVSSSNPETRYFGALEKGAYTFTAPDQESLTFSSPYETVVVNDQGTGTIDVPGAFAFTAEKPVERPVLDLRARYVNCLILTDLDATDDTQLALTLDTHWEFRTISTLYQLDYSRMPIEVYHAAMLACMRAGFFYENNTHQKILSAIGKGLKFAAPLIPGGNMLQLAHSAAQSILDNRAKKKPPAAAKTKSKAPAKGTMKQKGFK